MNITQPIKIIPGTTTCKGKPILPVMSYKWGLISISIFFMLASVFLITTKGLNYGVDFVGGTKNIYRFADGTKIDDVRNALDGLGFGDIQVIAFEEASQVPQYLIRVKTVVGVDVSKILTDRLVEKIPGKTELVSQETVGPKVGADLQKKAIASVALTCLLILIYTGFRFDFLFAPGAIIALFHDVLISVGFFAFFGREFTLPILAALLTILGFSVNDTIVVYDRIRENVKHLPKHISASRIVDISLTETFSRTIITSLTVFLVVVVLFFAGGGVLHDFAFCMIVGVVFGTYSSIFIASPIYLWLHKIFPNQGIKKTLKALVIFSCSVTSIMSPGVLTSSLRS